MSKHLVFKLPVAGLPLQFCMTLEAISYFRQFIEAQLQMVAGQAESQVMMDCILNLGWEMCFYSHSQVQSMELGCV